jgi:hypothetical protein
MTMPEYPDLDALFKLPVLGAILMWKSLEDAVRNEGTGMGYATTTVESSYPSFVKNLALNIQLGADDLLHVREARQESHRGIIGLLAHFQKARGGVFAIYEVVSYHASSFVTVGPRSPFERVAITPEQFCESIEGAHHFQVLYWVPLAS